MTRRRGNKFIQYHLNLYLEDVLALEIKTVNPRQQVIDIMAGGGKFTLLSCAPVGRTT